MEENEIIRRAMNDSCTHAHPTKQTITKKIVDVSTSSEGAVFFKCGDIKRAKRAGSNTAEQQPVKNKVGFIRLPSKTEL